LGVAWLFLVLVVVLITTAVGGGDLFLGHRGSAELVLIERDEVTDDTVIELDGSLVFGQRRRLGAEPRDHVVAGLATPDGVRELASSPVIELEIAWISEEAVKSAEFVVDGGVFQRRVEDVDRLILANHAWAILPLV